MSAKRCTSRVLIVDDAEIMHEIFCDILAPCARKIEDESPCYALSHARSGLEAINLTHAAIESDEGFSVAFIDLRLGDGMNGLEVASQIWQRDPDVHVVICTAFDDLNWYKATKELDCKDRLLLLKKPFHPDEVLQLTLSLSHRWHAAAEADTKLWHLQREVDQRLQVEANLRRMAEHDALTNLPNRSVLLERLNSILHAHQNGNCTIDAVLFMDLDNFKTINDSLGHDAGDELLNQVASRLRTCVRTGSSERRGRGETVRLGGDEFVVLLEQLQQPSDAITVARRIVDRIAEPFTIGDRSVNVGSSVGVAFVDKSALSPNDVLKNADTAMYRAKLSGKGRVAVFDSGMNQDVNARLELESSLRTSLQRDELNILYQPIVDLRTGEICSVEALLRWTMLDGKTVPPSRFIPLAEDIGLITEIGYWTISRAIDQIMELDQAVCASGIKPLSLAVNISHIQLASPDFDSRLGQITAEKRFSRNRLKLEINESIAMRKPQDTAERLKNLHDMGFGIHMDDFGTGHSSLACFHQFRIETVKIDRAFVGSIAHNESHQAIVEAVIQLAHSLKATVIAEGLETSEQIQQLRALGCDKGQGYFFASPQPQQQILRMLLDVDPASRLIAFSRNDPRLSPPPVPESPGFSPLPQSPAWQN
jgi:diguanylate cyclase